MYGNTILINDQKKEGNPSLPYERQWIEKARQGDIDSFNQLVHQYQRQAYYKALGMLGNADDAFDTIQDAFFSAYLHLPTTNVASFRGWLMQIVINECYNKLRKRHRQPATSLDNLPVDQDRLILTQPETPQDYAERQELASCIAECLATMPGSIQRTCILAFEEGFSYKEIAEMTHTTIGTVKSRLANARVKLRELLLAQDELVPSYYNSAKQGDEIQWI